MSKQSLVAASASLLLKNSLSEVASTTLWYFNITMEKKKHENRACVTITKENVGDFIRFNLEMRIQWDSVEF